MGKFSLCANDFGFGETKAAFALWGGCEALYHRVNLVNAASEESRSYLASIPSKKKSLSFESRVEYVKTLVCMNTDE
jgi:hypothetical protein